ncbi:MAG TPA: bifunctional phosphopantothenoylcysteine decarboxylase/phosphopantothenate--cysteine ligase CoaBC [Smithellaceae bacterium]|jgi:phosphopantothenoylcysteine decarboxylase / phosphopantothenate---cysteine ligase|nr:bifunctional phosphopantothenoylcysteine decarboxylase/phosphopantothenate--cysteine ligase CoaBC [Smithellaceae bacterium]HOQ71302.1 bifunctional phosphopantothenoylcysteine decarboxylase/phosphopantothenate--cysteine ligase CoaBC [Smithellaceae bacterium]HPL09631.1 bifunctional phosphopantothenoylcysteine decarboxylase/phosphopantothenate--cysteine ligase CoaBC [Smithellaceae bacterium]
MLKNKKIVLGITGGIAAYKSAELTRAFIKAGAEVKVIMTQSATEFIAPLTLRTLSRNPVYADMFEDAEPYDMAHIALAEWADAFVVAPATGNVIGKIASGIADDLLTTTLMAENRPTLICPAMNDKMLANAFVQENLRKLAGAGYRVMQSGVGELACNAAGAGRLPEIPEILDEMEALLTVQDFAGEKVLVTAGPTQEPLDPVRYITNHSSGKMGYALAKAAHQRGAQVTLISGPTRIVPPKVETVVFVRTAQEMHRAVMDAWTKASVIIKAAAVADYRPRVAAGEKIKKDRGLSGIELVRNPDIIADIGAKKKKGVLVGFAMETEDLLDNARRKMIRKNMDMIVANNLRDDGAGFEGDTNIITILDRLGHTVALDKMTKQDAAHRILDHIRSFKSKKGPAGKK